MLAMPVEFSDDELGLIRKMFSTYMSSVAGEFGPLNLRPDEEALLLKVGITKGQLSKISRGL